MLWETKPTHSPVCHYTEENIAKEKEKIATALKERQGSDPEESGPVE